MSWDYTLVPTVIPSEELLHTLAHELGHGLFTLRHTFSTSNRFYQPQTSTSNLMSYGPPTATRLYKYQWDQIQNPALALFSWMEREEEGQLSLPCIGWFDDCDDVLKILEKFREGRISGKFIKVRGQSKTDERTLTARLVKVGNTDYQQIRLIYKPTTSDYIFDPMQYNDYYQQIFQTDGTVDAQRGFCYYRKGEEMFKILVDDEIEKIQLLKEYLFGLAETIESKEAEITEYKYASGRRYGWLSAEQESGSDAGCALGYDNNGGCSYGKHQIAVRTGTLKKFVNWLNEKTSNQYSFFTEELINQSKEASSKKNCMECEFTKK